MLKWDQPQMIEGVTVYGDHASINTFYVFPDSPRYRIDPKTGLPVFRFLKYRNPVDRAGGKKGGGFIIFDVEFVVDQDTLNKVTAKLQEQLDQRYKNIVPKPQVQIGQISYLRGASNLQVLDSGGGLVQKIQNPGAPSLYGHMITPFTVELSDLGAPLAEQALQGSGGIVQVIYDLWTPVRLPDMTVTAWLNASKLISIGTSGVTTATARRYGKPSYLLNSVVSISILEQSPIKRWSMPFAIGVFNNWMMPSSGWSSAISPTFPLMIARSLMGLSM
jgi:hypothetical protein